MDVKFVHIFVNSAWIIILLCAGKNKFLDNYCGDIVNESCYKFQGIQMRWFREMENGKEKPNKSLKIEN